MKFGALVRGTIDAGRSEARDTMITNDLNCDDRTVFASMLNTTALKIQCMQCKAPVGVACTTITDAVEAAIKLGAARERARWNRAAYVEDDRSLGTGAHGEAVRKAIRALITAAHLAGDDPLVCPGCLMEAEWLCDIRCPDRRPVGQRVRRSTLP